MIEVNELSRKYGGPANGLDPAGIRWMRDLLRGCANRGGRGRIVAQGAGLEEMFLELTAETSREGAAA